MTHQRGKKQVLVTVEDRSLMAALSAADRSVKVYLQSLVEALSRLPGNQGPLLAVTLFACVAGHTIEVIAKNLALNGNDPDQTEEKLQALLKDAREEARAEIAGLPVKIFDKAGNEIASGRA